MLFTNPLMLFGLFALALPVIIHLFNFRRHKQFYFSNVELLKNLQQQTQRTNKLKHLVVLLLRLMLIASLVLAFARPYIPGENAVNPLDDKLVAFYIDNSLSMQAQGASSPLFDEARNIAMNAARGFQRNDLFVLLTNDMRAVHESPMTLEELIVNLEQLEISPASTPLSQITSRLATINDPENRSERLVFYLSDFQKSQHSLDNLTNDSSFRHFFIPISGTRSSNIYVDTCWFDSPVWQLGQTANLIARIVNDSEQAAEGVTVRLLLNNRQRASTSIDIPAASHMDVKLNFTNETTGQFAGTISITDYPVVFDDELHFAFEVLSQIEALEIYAERPNRWLKLLMEGDGLFRFDSRSQFQLDYQSIVNYDIVFLSGIEALPTGTGRLLAEFVESGGSLVVFPSENEANANKINDFLADYGLSVSSKADTARTRVFSLLLEHELFRDVFVRIPENVDLPSVFMHYPIRLQPALGATSIIDLLNGRSFLAESHSGNGRVYLFSGPLSNSWTDLQRHSLFVPLVYRLAFLSNRETKLYHTLGKNEAISTKFVSDKPDEVLTIRSLTDGTAFIPGHRNRQGRHELLTYDMVAQVGHYGLYAGDSLLNFLAWNHNRSESVMDFYTKQEIGQKLDENGFKRFSLFDGIELSKTDALERINTGMQLWKLFLIFALLFLLAEALVLRFWK